MTPVIVTLADNSEIRVYIEDIEFFLDEMEKLKLDLIDSVEPLDEAPLPQPPTGMELAEVDLTFIDGSMMQCSVPSEEMSELETCTLIRSCNGREVLCKLRTIAAVEKDLDRRLLGTYAVINNIPTLSRRSKLHEQYVKRKTAYVVAMEALVNGAFRD